MLKRLFIIGLTVLAGFVSVFAQTESADVAVLTEDAAQVVNPKKNRQLGIHPWKRKDNVNTRLAHWSLNFEGGIDFFDGDFNSTSRTIWPNSFIRPTGAVSLEYDFNPIWGVMLSCGYANYGAHTETGEAILTDGHMYTGELLFSFDLVDAWFPRRKSTVFSAYLLAGGGVGYYNSAFYPAQYNTIEQPLRRPREDGRYDLTAMVSLGMMLEWNLSRVMALNVRGMFRLYSKDNLESKIEGQTNDRMEYVTAGLRFKFGGYKKSHVRNFSSDRNDLADILETRKPKEEPLPRVDTLVVLHYDTIYMSDTLFSVDTAGRVRPTEVMKVLVRDIVETMVTSNSQAVQDSVKQRGAKVVEVREEKPIAQAQPTAATQQPVTPQPVTQQPVTQPKPVVQPQPVVQQPAPQKTTTAKPETRVVSRTVGEARPVSTAASGHYVEARKYVYFANGSTKLSDEALYSIQQIAQIMEDYPNCCIELTGVCDYTGSNKANDVLGQKRADRVAKELHDVYKIDYQRMIMLTQGKIDNVKRAYAPNRRCEVRLISWQQLQELREEYEVEAEEEVEEYKDEVAPKKEVPKTGALATVTTSKGMSLASLARKYYGNVHCWPYIYNANRAVLNSPDLLQPGKKLTIPRLTDAQLRTTESQAKDLLR